LGQSPTRRIAANLSEVGSLRSITATANSATNDRDDYAFDALNGTSQARRRLQPLARSCSRFQWSQEEARQERLGRQMSQNLQVANLATSVSHRPSTQSGSWINNTEVARLGILGVIRVDQL